MRCEELLSIVPAPQGVAVVVDVGGRRRGGREERRGMREAADAVGTRGAAGLIGAGAGAYNFKRFFELDHISYRPKNEW